ncbi:MAG: NAD-binding protein [Methanobrevibacter sp.]|uniref:NAD-binding protein n=1 Tax=Methanobrevibacter sp. TaxID=66852 RepID=UPI0026E0A2D7|nr:NAD-binding protein [Methanobrevibacter sp.]MDO5848058.1 NAD-binding protein [Methanobrevibacter sp.]
MRITLRKFARQIMSKLPLNYIRNGSILVIGLLIYGIIGSRIIMGLDFFNSLYYSIITMATVGYGDIVPKTFIQKIFSMTLALGGVGIITYMFSIILENFSKRMSEYSKGAKMYKKIKKMRDYYILCGYGRVGKVVFEELKQRNQNVIIIEKDIQATQDIDPDDSTVIINRDATEDSLLSQIIFDKCRSIIVTTGSDVTNLFIVLTIRELQPNAWVVSRCSKTENIKRLYKAGANKIVSPEIIGGADLYFEAAKPHLIRITLRHNVEDITREMKMIIDHKCTLENIDYHFPGIRAPLTRKIGVLTLEEIEEFEEKLKNNPQKRSSLKNLYDSVHEIHSHWISGSDKANIDRLIKEIEKKDKIIGIDLTNEEIAEITSKYIHHDD